MCILRICDLEIRCGCCGMSVLSTNECAKCSAGNIMKHAPNNFKFLLQLQNSDDVYDVEHVRSGYKHYFNAVKTYTVVNMFTETMGIHYNVSNILAVRQFDALLTKRL